MDLELSKGYDGWRENEKSRPLHDLSLLFEFHSFFALNPESPAIRVERRLLGLRRPPLPYSGENGVVGLDRIAN